MIRSGRSYTPEELEVRRKKGKEKDALQDLEPVKQKVTDEQVRDFLKLIKKSEYSIVAQLGRLTAQISILDLLLASEAHRSALLPQPDACSIQHHS